MNIIEAKLQSLLGNSYMKAGGIGTCSKSNGWKAVHYDQAP